MGIVMIGMGILTIIGGFAYTDLLANSPLTADMSWIGVVGAQSAAWLGSPSLLSSVS